MPGVVDVTSAAKAPKLSKNAQRRAKKKAEKRDVSLSAMYQYFKSQRDCKTPAAALDRHH